jgi:hypothetical protein
LNPIVATLVLFSTVVAALGLGVLAATWMVSAILHAFGPRSEQEAVASPLIPSQNHASGD